MAILSMLAAQRELRPPDRHRFGISSLRGDWRSGRCDTGEVGKVRLLADYFRTLHSDQLPIATTYLTGIHLHRATCEREIPLRSIFARS